MRNTLAENTKVASYLLWEKTKHGNALDLWYCAENIAFYFETTGIISITDLEENIKKSKYDFGYINFVRKVAYFIYLSTKNPNCNKNWFAAEALLNDDEWCKAIITMAYVFRVIREGKTEPTLRSEYIKKILTGDRK